MEVIYYGDDMPETFSKSLFLAGPTPRTSEVKSWRPDALSILEELEYDGVVFIPEFKDKKRSESYDELVQWEEKFLNIADCIVFWVPRDLKDMPAFTTNVEFGAWHNTGKIVYGAPPDAPKNSYLKYYAEQTKTPISDTLKGTLENALSYLGDGAKRKEGERYVPLYIWNTPPFKAWYNSQIEAGHSLEKAELLYTFRPNKRNVFLSVLKVSVSIFGEGRIKDNEFVIFRPDITSILLYKKGSSLEKSEVVLVKEYRAPAVNEVGFIYELPGGSSFKETNLKKIALEEVKEEVGLDLSEDRLELHSSRQLAGTILAHRSHLFTAELTEEEMEECKKMVDPRGNEKETERTYVEVLSIKSIMHHDYIDCSNVGQILTVMSELFN